MVRIATKKRWRYFAMLAVACVAAPVGLAVRFGGPYSAVLIFGYVGSAWVAGKLAKPAIINRIFHRYHKCLL